MGVVPAALLVPASRSDLKSNLLHRGAGSATQLLAGVSPLVPYRLGADADRINGQPPN